MWIKICANTNLEDAKAAAELGADALGFVFAMSKRQVTAKLVAAIVSGLPEEVEKIGVFDSQGASTIGSIVRATGLTGVQLHGGLDAGLVKRLRDELGGKVTIIQTLHWKIDGDSDDAEQIAAQLSEVAETPTIDCILIDSKTNAGSGGTGMTFDWKAAKETLAASQVKLIVAGGLRPENVADAIASLTPWGLDVASGVEAAPGSKDLEKVRQFITNARTFR